MQFKGMQWPPRRQLAHQMGTLLLRRNWIWRFRQFIPTTLRRLFANIQVARLSANADHEIHFKIEFADIQYQHGIA
jgi:hypothetical protein